MSQVAKLIKNELLLQHYLKVIYIFIACISVLALLSSWAQYAAFKSDRSNYNQIKDSYIQSGISVKRSLEDGYQLEKKGNSVSVTNDLKYAYVKCQRDIVAMSPKNVIDQALSSTIFLALPLLLALYTIVVTGIDLKSHVFKVKNTMNKITTIILAKLFSLYIVASTALLLVCGLFALGQLYFRSKIVHNSGFQITTAFSNHQDFLKKAPIQLLAIWIMVLIVVTVCFYLTLIAKSTWFSTVALGVYYLMLPPLGNLDFKQNMLLVYHRLFSNSSATFTPASINGTFSISHLTWCIVLIGLIIVIMHLVVCKKGYLSS